METRTSAELVAAALAAGDETAARYVTAASAGILIRATVSPGWEVEYAPTGDPARPWTDDEGNRFATNRVGPA